MKHNYKYAIEGDMVHWSIGVVDNFVKHAFYIVDKHGYIDLVVVSVPLSHYKGDKSYIEWVRALASGRVQTDYPAHTIFAVTTTYWDVTIGGNAQLTTKEGMIKFVPLKEPIPPQAFTKPDIHAITAKTKYSSQLRDIAISDDKLVVVDTTSQFLFDLSDNAITELSRDIPQHCRHKIELQSCNVLTPIITHVNNAALIRDITDDSDGYLIFENSEVIYEFTIPRLMFDKTAMMLYTVLQGFDKQQGEVS